MLEKLQLSDVAPLSITSLVINLLVGAFLSIILKYHYKKFGSTITNREEFSNVFPFVLLTTVLVISIVKSSLALSLGLVGALSIVRFRTPIKEPEELSYLFLSIATGLGLGANQTIPTIVSILVILFFIVLLKLKRNNTKEKNMYLNIECKLNKNLKSNEVSKKLNNILSDQNIDFDLRKLEINQDNIELIYIINIRNLTVLESIIKELEKNFLGISITYIDQNQVPSI